MGMKAIGVMGGTFDPIHFGHLVAAEEARVRFRMERVIFVPNGDPPHKKAYEVTGAERRYEMVVLATASNPHFEASRIEIDRTGPSYTVDTMWALREKYGLETPLYFITGVDAVLELMTWHEPEHLVELCEVIAVTRPGYHADRLSGALSPSLASHTHLLRIPGVAISSTELRERPASGESLRYLTPMPVVQYIATHRLYGADGTARGERTSDGWERPPCSE